MSLTWKERWDLIKLLRVDVYMMLFFVSFSISGISLNQLVEDKICLNELKLDKSVCLNLEHVNSRESDKNYILSSAAVFKNYQTLVLTTPGIFLSMFIGYWIDNYPSHLKYILAAPALAGTIGSLIIVYNCLHFEMDFMLLLVSDGFRGIAGGFATIYTGVYTYITRKTPSKFRALRFSILEFFSFVATPISIYLGGFILTTKSMFDNQPRNYIGVFIISGICSFIASIWVLVFVRDSDSGDQAVTDSTRRTTTVVVVDEPLRVEDMVEQNTLDEPDSYLKQHLNGPRGCCSNSCHTFFDIFNVKNAVAMVKTCTKKRENGLRCRIWHSIIISTFALLAYMGDTAIGFPFAQKVYHWDAKYYSNVSSLLILVPSLATTFMSPILIRKFGFTDTGLGILGCVSMMSSMIIRGGWLTSTGYFVASFSGMFSGLFPISIRSFISRMIRFDEIGQVYSLLSAVESFAPAISSLYYSTIFKLTISSYPGLVYQIAAILLVYPLITILWLDLTKKSWYEKSENMPTDHSENGEQVNPETSQSSLRGINSLNSNIETDMEQLIDNQQT